MSIIIMELLVDVAKTAKKSSMLFTFRSVVWLLGVLLTVLLFWAFTHARELSVNRQNILIEPIQRGDLVVQIDGYGNLTSNKQQLITSFSSATVKEIVLKPGAQVSTNSIIVRLENPDLVQQVENAEQELIQATANLRQLKLNNKREKLNESGIFAEIKALHDSAALRRVAEEKLVEQGIVSQLTFQQTVLDENQLKQRIAILQERIEQLDLVHKESLNIQRERIKQQQGRLNIAQSRLSKLTVRAGFDGVLQRLSVDLGQSLIAGQEVALIGSVSDLIALIRVPQSQAQLVLVGKPAIIDTRRDKIEGVVSRINPIVENNTVEIEISLTGALPASARPQQSVDAIIVSDTLRNVSYIKRPAGAKPNTTVSLYRVDDTLQGARTHEIRFGIQAGQFMQVLSGGAVNEKFIISDLSNLQSTNQYITIN